MIAKILIHPLLEVRSQKVLEILNTKGLKKDHPDVLWIEDEKLGMEAAKQVREFFSLKPYSAQGRAVVVLQAQNLTLDAQNSLLKTLEEPPHEAIILLGAQTDKKILPTVLSRCEVVILEKVPGPVDRGQEDKTTFDNDIEKLLKLEIEERFEYIEKLEDKDTFLNALLVYYRSELITHHTSPITNFAKELLHAEAWREANGNIRAILEYLMLRIPG